MFQQLPFNLSMSLLQILLQFYAILTERYCFTEKQCFKCHKVVTLFPRLQFCHTAYKVILKGKPIFRSRVQQGVFRSRLHSDSPQDQGTTLPPATGLAAPQNQYFIHIHHFYSRYMPKCFFREDSQNDPTPKNDQTLLPPFWF